MMIGLTPPTVMRTVIQAGPLLLDLNAFPDTKHATSCACILNMKAHKIALPFLAILAPSIAYAHVGFGETSGFSHGLTHPAAGLDHLCTMIAVGLWAAQMGGRAIWAVPAAFVCIVLLGGAFGIMGTHFPFIEPGIGLSVLILGVLIAAAVRLPLPASIVIGGMFALCHGHAHGAEMQESMSGLAYAGGFILATGLLHASGIGLGIAIERVAASRFVRFAGATIALCGITLWIA
jgi:urease accessory protein